MKSIKLKKLLVKKSRIKTKKETVNTEEQKFKDLLCEMIQKEAYLGVNLMLEDKLRQIAKEKSDRIIDLRTENHN